ncbi:MAG: ribosome hibernation-promoting factor, HPF/YfiA family [Propionibacteriaceae bacterium]
MDIVVTGRRCHISEEFRSHVAEKLSAVEKFRERIQRIEVQVSAGMSKEKDTAVVVDITVLSKGPVVRASAASEDKTVAFDMAMDKLKGQMRKAADRRKSHKHLRGTELTDAFVSVSPQPVVAETPLKRIVAGDVEMEGDGPLVVREKRFDGVPLTLAQALDEMELVGHDFFLYVDAETRAPSVVYRRRAYDYGVIHLDVKQ